MVSIKPSVPEKVVRQAVQACLGDTPFTASPLDGGLVARAFLIDAGDGRYVLRFNPDTLDATFRKEAFIASTFRSDLVPIPEVVAYGKLEGLQYCLTRWVRGRRLHKLTPPDLLVRFPVVAGTLLAIHAADISGFTGSGVMDDFGHGFHPDWPSSLLQVRDEERPDGFYGKWHSLFDTTFLRRDTFDAIFAQLESRLPYLPAERWLFHGNFGFGNVLIAGTTVTAVIDWFESGYGDFVYDVAWLDYWDTQLEFSERLRPVYESRGYNVENWDQRLRCYQCRIALDSMRFFAKSDDERGYDFTTRRIAALLA